MDFFIQDPDEIRLPPEEVRLLEVQVIPIPDSQRVKVFIELTPFIKRPNLEISIANMDGKVIAQTAILESMLPKIELIMHLREADPGDKYTLVAKVYYQSLPTPSVTSVELPFPEPMVVDQQRETFYLPQPGS